ncbi:tRNA-splicing endonuclease subunit Sen2-like [Musca vetustissima]|uniref:tRNA-splicing endonuclease subunit Sen2-like n=1 Tax=Musca vetustissima TaxID=27455 RepID=UPI002AB72E6A|nr:tRNA-splicing endonuclease subunit Sen2-like [Musca vetustissima]
MFFVPHLKHKRGGTYDVLPFPPPCTNEGQDAYNGIFTGISVEICNANDIRALYTNGFYGKGSQSRSVPNVVYKNPSEIDLEERETLSLGLEESFFLAYYLRVLKIFDFDEKEITWEDFMKSALKVNGTFVESVAAYVYLKSKGWVVKSGLKFAGNYLIYSKGPRFFHASFVVIVNIPSNTQHLEPKKIKGLQRIAETSDKDVLLLDITKPKNFKMQTPQNIAMLNVTESIIKRFNYTSYVQTQRNSIS